MRCDGGGIEALRFGWLRFRCVNDWEMSGEKHLEPRKRSSSLSHTNC